MVQAILSMFDTAVCPMCLTLSHLRQEFFAHMVSPGRPRDGQQLKAVGHLLLLH